MYRDKILLKILLIQNWIVVVVLVGRFGFGWTDGTDRQDRTVEDSVFEDICVFFASCVIKLIHCV